MEGKNDLIEQVRKFVEDECQKPTSHYSYEIYFCHFMPVVAHAKNLAKQFTNVDIEVLELAAWLHDIGSVMKGRENHHITGAEIAEEKLKEFGYPQEKIEKVKKCIFSHRGSQELPKESIEAQILADADALSAFDNVSGLFKAAIFCEGLDQITAKRSVKQKLQNSWAKLSPYAKNLIQHKYLAAMILLE